MTGRVGRWLDILFFLVPLMGAMAAPAAATDDNRLLKLKAGSFDPAAGVPEDLLEKTSPSVTLAAPAKRGDLFIVQFRSTPVAAQKARLAGLGVKVLDYLPENALVVRLPAGAPSRTLTSIAEVRAAVPLAPGLRMSQDLRGPAAGGEEVRINAWLSADGDPHALAEAVQKAFPEVIPALIRREPAPRVQFSGPPARLESLAAALARHPDVLFVDRARPDHLVNDQSIWIGQSYDRVSGPGEAAAADPKPYTLSGTVFHHGITGTGQVIAVADSRLEHQLCYFNDPARPLVKQTVAPPGALTVDPGQRKILAYNNVSPNADSPPYGTWRHGTHTAGSAVGDSLANLSTPVSAGHDAADGMAPNAKLVYMDMTDPNNLEPNCVDGLCKFCNVTADVLKQEYDAGARVSTNSYIGDAGNTVDAALWQRPDFLVFFAAGNDGSGGTSVSGYAAQKNVVSVGATEYYDPTLGLDPENLAAFTDVGLSDRIKPDLSAPGVSVPSAAIAYTAYQPGDPHCVPGPNVCILPPGFPLAGACYVSDPTQTCATVRLSGTSMSTPTAAGLGALARQYFTDGFYPTGQASPTDSRIPSAALLKAVLINGARNMTGRLKDGNTNPPLLDAPSNRQGWGRVMLDDALYFAGDTRRLFVADTPSESGLADGDSVFYQVDVACSASPLKVTLAWTDPPPMPLAAKPLVNDLDLIVTSPNGTVYKGNQWTLDDPAAVNDKQSAANPPGRDDQNNVEGVLIRQPQPGLYRVEIRGAAVPGTPIGITPSLSTQGFGLVVTGEFTGGSTTVAPPTIAAVLPDFALNNRPALVSISGSLFQAIPQVYLGSATLPQEHRLSGVTFIGPNRLQATVPADLATGLYLLKIVNPDGGWQVLNDAFTVGAPPKGSTRSPSSRGSNPMLKPPPGP
jgi:hypothetical protein